MPTEPHERLFRFVPDASSGDSTELLFDQLPSLQGQSFTGEWWSVAPDRLSTFETATYTTELRNPWGANTFPDKLVEGFHLVGLLEYMMNAVLHPRYAEGFGWNYGLDRVRFVTPVRTDDRIRITGTIAEVRPKDDGFLIRQDCTIEVEGRDKPGFIAQWWVFWLPGSPD